MQARSMPSIPWCREVAIHCDCSNNEIWCVIYEHTAFGSSAFLGVGINVAEHFQYTSNIPSRDNS